MKSSNIVIIISLVFIAAVVIWFIFFRDKASIKNQPAGQTVNQRMPIVNEAVPQVSSQIQLTEDNKLARVTINASTNQRIASQELSLSEAVEAVGGYSNLCMSPERGGYGAYGYLDEKGMPVCSSVRGGL